jgi:hypothetical protein
MQGDKGDKAGQTSSPVHHEGQKRKIIRVFHVPFRILILKHRKNQVLIDPIILNQKHMLEYISINIH